MSRSAERFTTADTADKDSAEERVAMRTFLQAGSSLVPFLTELGGLRMRDADPSGLLLMAVTFLALPDTRALRRDAPPPLSTPP